MEFITCDCPHEKIFTPDLISKKKSEEHEVKVGGDERGGEGEGRGGEEEKERKNEEDVEGEEG